MEIKTNFTSFPAYHMLQKACCLQSVITQAEIYLANECVRTVIFPIFSKPGGRKLSMYSFFFFENPYCLFYFVMYPMTAELFVPVYLLMLFIIHIACQH